MTTEKLNALTVKDLILLAGTLDIAGRHKMRKADLIAAIIAKQPLTLQTAPTDFDDAGFLLPLPEAPAASKPAPKRMNADRPSKPRTTHAKRFSLIHCLRTDGTTYHVTATHNPEGQPVISPRSFTGPMDNWADDAIRWTDALKQRRLEEAKALRERQAERAKNARKGKHEKPQQIPVPRGWDKVEA